MSLLTIVQKAATRLGVNPASGTISAAFSNADQNIQQLVAFAQDAGDEVAERVGWKNLRPGGQITGDGTSGLFSLPSDFARMTEKPILVSSLYPTTSLVGPVNTERLLQLKQFPATLLPAVWRLTGGSIEIWPSPANLEVITFEYYSSYWVLGADATTRQSEWESDADTSLIDEKIIRYGVMWRWQQAKGLDYAENFRRYESGIDRLGSADQGARDVSMTSHVIVDGDTYFPGTITDNR